MASSLLLLFDLIGTFVFALSGGIVAVRYRLDLFGVLVLACAAAVSGGITRDVLIGAQPPAALADWRYLAAAILAGVVTFRWHETIERLRNPVQLFDAVGLGLFGRLAPAQMTATMIAAWFLAAFAGNLLPFVLCFQRLELISQPAQREALAQGVEAASRFAQRERGLAAGIDDT